MAAAGEMGHAAGSAVADAHAVGARVSINQVNIEIADHAYTGEFIEPTVSATFDGKALSPGTDFVFSYGHNVNPGTGLVTVTGVGRFSGVRTVSFAITKPIASLTVSSVDAQGWTGEPIEPAFKVSDGATVLIPGTDYKVRFENNVNPGTATAIISGMGGYSGAVSTTFPIAKTIAHVDAIPIAVQKWTGKAIEPSLCLTDHNQTLVCDRDYRLSYENNVDPGTATISVEGLGAYTGSTAVEFAIAKDISDASVAPIAAQNWTGEPIEPAVTVSSGARMLVPEVDYALAFEHNVDAGKATVKVTGVGKCSGVCTSAFAIIKDLSLVTVKPTASQAWTGKPIEPQLSVVDGKRALVAGHDYNVTFSNNVDHGTADAKLVGIGDYAGTQCAHFVITRDLAGASLKEPAAETFTGEALCPKVVVSYDDKTLEEGVDYTLSYERNVELGHGVVVVAGIGDFSGTNKVEFAIVQDLSEASIATIDAQEWTGEALEPKPEITFQGALLEEGTDYTLEYADNVEPGLAKVIVNGTNRYAGSAVALFSIGGKMGLWKHEAGKWWYRYTDGSYPKAQFFDEHGSRYYFDESGWMVTGWKRIDNGWYFFRSDGKMGAKDWVQTDGKWWYLGKDGKLAMNQWVQYDGAWHWLDASGAMAVGWTQVRGRWFYFEDNGAMATGWKRLNGKWYYLQPQAGDDLGVMVCNNWVEKDGNKCYLGETGAMVLGWKLIGDKWYYFNSDGAMATSKWVGNYWLGPDGFMLTNQWVDGRKYFVGEDGAWMPSVSKP